MFSVAQAPLHSCLATNFYSGNITIGRGGMGEVWQAYDLKLQVDVALKSIRPERFPGEQGLELLRKEVRSAREVMSPNVCRIFDLVEEEGQEFVSMEWVDGATLLDVLRNRGPLDLQEATRLASQFLAGLEAIHQAGLVHRDVKPENIMITRTGRVVLMDFGIAKGIAEGHRGTIAGTPAYMAPEQSRGEALDARADIFAAGVVLAEMIAREGVRQHKTRESIWHSVRKVPVQLFESPWRGVLERAVAAERSERYGPAQELARALEEVTLRVEGAEDQLMAAMLIMAFLFSPMGTSPVAATETRDIDILGTSDLHGNTQNYDYFTDSVPTGSSQRGLTKLLTYINAVRAVYPNTILIDNGDTIQGNPLAYYFNMVDTGRMNPLAKAMNYMGYVAATVGNREFNYGPTVFNKFQTEAWAAGAGFPTLSANVTGCRDYTFTPYVIKDVGGVQVGILGLTPPAVVH